MNNTTTSKDSDFYSYFIIPLESVRVKAIEIIQLSVPWDKVVPLNVSLAMLQNSDELHNAIKNMAISIVFGLCNVDKNGLQAQPVYQQPFVNLDAFSERTVEMERVLFKIFDQFSSTEADPSSVSSIVENIAQESMNLLIHRINLDMPNNFPCAVNTVKVLAVNTHPQSDICIVVLDQNKLDRDPRHKLFSYTAPMINAAESRH